VDFDLLCKSKWTIGLLGSTFYIGEFVASFLISLFALNSRINALKYRNWALLLSMSLLAFQA
jgi:hypothetical protein